MRFKIAREHQSKTAREHLNHVLPRWCQGVKYALWANIFSGAILHDEARQRRAEPRPSAPGARREVDQACRNQPSGKPEADQSDRVGPPGRGDPDRGQQGGGDHRRDESPDHRGEAGAFPGQERAERRGEDGNREA